MPSIMKLPCGLRWLPPAWRWSALSEGDRLMLALSLSLLLHTPLFMRLAIEGSLRGQPQAMSVRLAGSTVSVRPAAAMAQVPAAAPVAQGGARSAAGKVLLVRKSKRRLADAASAAPEHVAPAAAAMLPDAATLPPADTDTSTQLLGFDFYYAARQVDMLAVEQMPIQLVEPYGLGMEDVDITLRVYINEQGGVDAVQLVSAKPAGAEQPLMEIFRQARFYPALRGGQPVKSFKLIHIGPLQDGAEARLLGN